MPAGLINHTWPFALNLPSIEEAPFAGLIRFNIIELLEGCWKLTRSCGATLNEFQLIIALSDVWLICTVLASGEVIVALPPTTSPASGLAKITQEMSMLLIKSINLLISRE